MYLNPPFETYDPVEAGIDDPRQHTAPVDAAAGFLGVIRLHSASYCVLVSQIRRAASLPSGPVVAVQRIRMLKLGPGQPSKEDREFMAPIAKLLESGTLYYSLDSDISRSLGKGAASCDDLKSSSSAPPVRVGNAFWWTWPMARLAGAVASTWALRTVYGFVGTETMRFASSAIEYAPNGVDFNLTLISRRSRRRAGTRYITRGVDALGDVANFVETEQVIWQGSKPDVYSAFALIRGSVPVFWRQNNGIARPSPELDGTITASRAAFSTHFRNMVRSYGGVTAVSLVDLAGSEAVLAEAFERHFDLDIKDSFDGLVAPRLVAFDFHTHCGGKDYERGIAMLLKDLKKDLIDFGFFTQGISKSLVAIPHRQRGVFRVNCVDCLDRTNVVQSMLARVVLDTQLVAVFHDDLKAGGLSFEQTKVILVGESSDRFKHVWGDNADAISKQYSGTGAMKTDFTRTGKRSTTGIVGDGVKSVVRMYYKNFVDEGRQEAIDITCGYASVRPRSSRGESLSGPGGVKVCDDIDAGADDATADWQELDQAVLPRPQAEDSCHGGDGDKNLDDSPLWYTFNALRINGGGDRQPVVVQLRDNVMHLATQEGVNFEYPRYGLASWEKRDEPKSGDRKSWSRLRLIHHPSMGSPAAASPLDLLFRLGSTARENFIRAYLAWAKPEVLERIGGSVRIRVLSARGVGKHRMADWGLGTKLTTKCDDIGRNTSGAGSDNHSINCCTDTQMPSECEGREIVVLVVPEAHSGTREWGLAAVPVDIDQSGYILVSARAVSSRGPAIAVLASQCVAPLVMSVKEAMVGRAGSLTGGGAVGVSLIVSGTSLCFVSARLAGAKDLFRVLTSLKLSRNAFDVTNQFEHFYVAGVMGDLQWRSGDVPDDGPCARHYLRLGDGSRAYSLGCGLSVMSNSFPTLQVNDILSKTSFWQQRKVSPTIQTLSSFSSDVEDKEVVDTKLTGPALAVALADDVVSGGLPPILPDELSLCVVTLSDLRGENIKMPPGIDQSTPLNTFFAVYSDLVGSDGIATRQTIRATDQPEWRESIQLKMIPSDVEEVKRSFLLGQVLIPTPLSDAVPAGHCVLPIAYATDGRAEFNIPLRLAGIATGRLRGVIHFDYFPANSGPAVGTNAGVRGVKHGVDGQSSSVPRPELLVVQDDPVDCVQEGHGGKLPSNSSRAEPSSFGMFGAAPVSPRTNLEDMNEKLDVARRKGAKKVKSMVGMLSSLLNQSPSPRVSSDTVDPAGRLGKTSLEGRFYQGDGETAWEVDTNNDTNQWSSKPFPGSKAMNSEATGPDMHQRIIERHSDRRNIDLDILSDRDAVGGSPDAIPPSGDFRWKQKPPVLPTAPSPLSSRANSRKGVQTELMDPVLAGLASSRSRPILSSIPSSSLQGRSQFSDNDASSVGRASVDSTCHERAKPAIIGDDDLLAGLATAKLNCGTAAPDDNSFDEWGGFEAAAPKESEGARGSDLSISGAVDGIARLKNVSSSTGSLLDK
jgi:phosphatidylinositol 4-phosphatase